MLTSVVIATHNDGELLDRTVQSCFSRQNGEKWEIIVFDGLREDAHSACADLSDIYSAGGCWLSAVIKWPAGDTMRTTIIIATRDDGDLLSRTLQSCRVHHSDEQPEIVVVDNGSTSCGIRAALTQHHNLRLFRHELASGPSPTKHFGACHAKGEVLVFLDGHCTVEGDAIEHLVAAVERLDGRAIVMPRIAHLDVASWRPVRTQVGGSLLLDLVSMQPTWARSRQFRCHGEYVESAALMGCAFAISRSLYDDLWGFDTDMRCWGSEDGDLSLKAWTMGYSVVHDPSALIAHRFRNASAFYQPGQCEVVANELRMARKNLTDSTWRDWCERAKGRHGDELFAAAWGVFESRRESVEREREYLMARRTRDEFWFAEYFGLEWPAG